MVFPCFSTDDLHGFDLGGLGLDMKRGGNVYSVKWKQGFFFNHSSSGKCPLEPHSNPAVCNLAFTK